MKENEVNLALEELGYIKKGKGVTLNGYQTWDLTEEGKLHGEPSRNPYSTSPI